MSNAILSKKEITKCQRMAPPLGTSPLQAITGIDQIRGRDLLSINDLSAPEILLILETAALLKANKFDETQMLFAKGQTLALLFEKPSLRTRVTFEAGMTQLGGNAIYIEGKLGKRESVGDVSKNLDRWLDGIMARVFDHQTLVDLANNADIPVINGLSNLEHPCQAMADFLTLQEHKGRVEGLKLAFIGDGNNVANSLALTAAKLGCHFSVACPEGYEPDSEIWDSALCQAEQTGARLTVTHDPKQAVYECDAVYTDTWISMGQESESLQRSKDFQAYQLNGSLLDLANRKAIVMHCLPAHRGHEITDEVIDGAQSVVFNQAENRLHVQKAILSLVL